MPQSSKFKASFGTTLAFLFLQHGIFSFNRKTGGFSSFCVLFMYNKSNGYGSNFFWTLVTNNGLSHPPPPPQKKKGILIIYHVTGHFCHYLVI